MWVPLIENNEHLSAGADYFINKCVNQLLEQSPSIDTILLGCTHYPLITEKIRQAAGDKIRIVSQGEIVAASLADYLERHPEIETKLSKNRQRKFYTTDSTEDFDRHAEAFFGAKVKSEEASLM